MHLNENAEIGSVQNKAIRNVLVGMTYIFSRLIFLLSFFNGIPAFYHLDIQDSFIKSCYNLPFMSLFIKNLCIVQRDGQDCGNIIQRITSKYPEYIEMNIKDFEPKLVQHINKLNFFEKFEPNQDFCIISKLFLIAIKSTFKPAPTIVQKVSSCTMEYVSN